MTIEAGGYQEFTVRIIKAGRNYIRGGKNNWPMVLLRPQRAGRFARWLPDLGEGTLHIWTNKYRDGIWRTRAQAAQAANG